MAGNCQNEVRSVQEKLEKALSQVANEPVNVFCAGRTDAGVHGTGQVVHFETTALRKDAAWTLGVNANLPGDIAVRWVKAVPEDFHARFSATGRPLSLHHLQSSVAPGDFRSWGYALL